MMDTPSKMTPTTKKPLATEMSPIFKQHPAHQTLHSSVGEEVRHH